MTAKNAKVEEVEKSLVEPWAERADNLRQQALDLEGQVRDTVRQNPVVCLLGAVAAGYLVGRIVARR